MPRRLKFKTDRTVIAKVFPAKIVREVRRALKDINAGRPYPPESKNSRRMEKG
jgi:hypothetical protein